MKFLSTVLVISSIFGTHCLTEPEQPQVTVRDLPIEAHGRAAEEKERSGYSHATATAVVRPMMVRPMSAPSQVPLPLVECYVCADCPDINANTSTKLCPYTRDPTKRNKCVVYTEQYKHMKQPYHIRACASERGSCADVRNVHSAHTDVVQLLNCRECEGDRCNSASLSLVDLTMGLFTVIVTPLVAKYTLS